MAAHVQLEKVLDKQIKDGELTKLYEDFDLPLVPVLTKMELVRRSSIDSDELGRQSAELSEDIKRLEKEISLAAGGSFNIASPKQLAEVLFEKLKLPSSKKAKTGFSTHSEVLEGFARQASYREPHSRLPGTN